MKLALHRLGSQQLLKPGHTRIADLVAHLGAMQAQDFAMSKWAIGVRLPGITDRDVTHALDAGEIIRTHVLRPTWHTVAAGDLRWMLELTGPHVRSSMASRHRDLEITPVLEAKSRKLIEKAIGTRGPLTREEIADVLERGGIVLGESRLPHLLMLAELDAVICSGPLKGVRPSYALVDERVPVGSKRTRDAALAELAIRYFTGHGPATVRDFVWWSGLPVKDARRAIAALPGHFRSLEEGGETYWYLATGGGATKKSHVVLLPAYDEFLIAYANRAASLPSTIAKGVVSSNGIFRAVVAVNGRVIGLWSRSMPKAGVAIAVTLLDGAKAPARAALEAASGSYAAFLGKPLVST